MKPRKRTERRTTAALRRWGLPGLAAALGVVLVLCGLAVALVDAQLRSDAATTAVAITDEQREKLDGLGSYQFVLEDLGNIRKSLIMQNLASGGTMPERAFDIVDFDDGTTAVQWNLEAGYLVTSWGGWQMKPVGILTFAGLSLLIASGFLSAGRWESRHPLP